MERKFTKGPWSYRKCACGDQACTQHIISIQGSVGFEELDARLIAAAPKLLSAAEKLIAAFDEISATVTERIITGRSDADIRRSSNEAIAELRAAIAHATQEPQA